ncbi:hypothetical protein [Actinoplanes sp. NPDC026619]|uniref:hypothetical protein n=1 Tax=Actinoplanes sp. NPDC026619 TaxID=3155798 RepID=UPI0033E78CED
MSRLAAGYRLLLRVYPPGRRRDEMLDTLLEAAPAGRRRPTAREAANLLRHGLRARLGRPAGRGVVVLATLIALVTGFVGASVATRLAWELVPGYPTGATLAEISGTIYPAVPVTHELDTDELFFDVSERSTLDVFLQGHDEDFAFATLGIYPEPRFLLGDYPTWTAATQGRLVAAGWQVSEARVTGPTTIATGQVDDTGRSFTATRDGLALEIETSTDVVGTPPGGFDATATLDRLTPGYVQAATVLGLLTGALFGWLLTGWASRRTEQAGAAIRTLTWLPSSCALVLLLPQALAAYLILAVQFAADGPPGEPFWAYSVTYAFGCGLLGFLLLAVALVAALLARRPADDPAVEREFVP